MEEWSERDRQKLKEAQDKMSQKMEVMKKEFNADHSGPRKQINRGDGINSDLIVNGGGDDLALALYDNGDPNSRHN